MSRLPYALIPLQQSLMTRSPHGSGTPPLHVGTEIVQEHGVGTVLGRNLSLRQEESGQHSVHNHLNVITVFRIWNAG